MKVSQILNKAAELVEKGWCQDTEARDARGTEVPWDHDSATKFCASGAIRKVANEGHEGYVNITGPRSVLEESLVPHDRKSMSYCSIPAWNDCPDQTQEEVVRALRKAAEISKGERT